MCSAHLGNGPASHEDIGAENPFSFRLPALVPERRPRNFLSKTIILNSSVLNLSGIERAKLIGGPDSLYWQKLQYEKTLELTDSMLASNPNSIVVLVHKGDLRVAGNFRESFTFLPPPRLVLASRSSPPAPRRSSCRNPESWRSSSNHSKCIPQ
jgi:hypothetical protein